MLVYKTYEVFGGQAAGGTIPALDDPHGVKIGSLANGEKVLALDISQMNAAELSRYTEGNFWQFWKLDLTLKFPNTPNGKKENWAELRTHGKEVAEASGEEIRLLLKSIEWTPDGQVHTFKKLE